MRNFSYPGRSAVRARNAMITTSHPMATAAGLKVLTEGGSAVDAAITAVAVQTMAEPHMTGIGGDCFALISPDGSADIKAMNASGRAPQGISAAALTDQGMTEIPRYGPHAITVPGAVDGWWRLHQRYGRFDWDRLMQPAVDYASDGIAVHDRVARDWGRSVENVTDDPDASAQYLNSGKAYQAGEVFCHPKLAETMGIIQQHGRDGFYQGPVMEDMVAKLQSEGGFHQEKDFTDTEASFVDPIRADYRGHTVWECPPNGQGVTALLLLRMMERFDLETLSDRDRIHVLAEVAKLAYHLRDTYLADPSFSPVPVEWLLADEQVDGFVAMISRDKATEYAPSDFPDHPHTVYLAAVDEDGMAVSLINSIFDDFGSGISTPEYGVLFHSRGKAFRLEADHPNAIEGGKRPLHTIIPGMLSQDDRLVGPFGVMGGQYQAVGHAMLLSNMFNLGMNPQQALDAPRSFAHAGVLQLEDSHGAEMAGILSGLGHEVDFPSSPIGGGQAIIRDAANGVLVAGSDPRKDGHASGY